jgi:hypothetical protein
MGVDPLGDQRARAREALFPDLAPQAGLIRTALRQTGLEVGGIRIDLPDAPVAPLIERERLAPDPDADRLGIETTGRGYLAEGLALSKAHFNLLIAVHPGRMPSALLLLEPRGTPVPGQGPGERGDLRGPLGHGRGWRGASLDRRDGGRGCWRLWRDRGLAGQHTAQGGRDPLQIAGQRLTEITQEVKAVCNLGRLRGAFGRTARIIRGAITGNDFDPWMGAQPCRHGIRGTLGQQIDRPLLFEIHQDRAIDAALAEGKIIDPQDPRCGLRRRRGALENAEDRIATEGHPQPAGHPCAGFTARLAPEDTDSLGEPHGTLRARGRESGEVFNKRLAGTRRRQTAKAADMYAEAHGLLDNGQVTQVARIAAVHACRRGVTIGAGGRGRIGTGVDEERGVSRGDVFHHQARQGKRKQRRRHTIGDTSRRVLKSREI